MLGANQIVVLDRKRQSGQHVDKLVRGRHLGLVTSRVCDLAPDKPQLSRLVVEASDSSGIEARAIWGVGID